MVAALRCVGPQFQWYQLAYATEIKSIQLHDFIVRLSQKIVSFTLHYITLHTTQNCVLMNILLKLLPELFNLLLRSLISWNVLILTRAYITYVRPLLEYCTYLWSPVSLSELLDRQNWACSEIFFKESSISNQTPLSYPTWSSQTWNIRNETN